MHPQDMLARNLEDDAMVEITSRVGRVITQVMASEEVMKGVVCLPHGWGHKRPGVQFQVASQQDGVSVNDLTDEQFIDELSGNAALNGVPVTVTAASSGSHGEDCISVTDIVILMIKHEGMNLTKLNRVLEKKKKEPKKLMYSKRRYKKIPIDRKKQGANDFWKKQLKSK